MASFSFKTPGVYVVEESKFPPSVVPVETAIPVFIGYTAQALDADGATLTDIPTRITSFLEFEQMFGGGEVMPISVNVVQTGTNFQVRYDTDPGLPDHFLYYSMRLFFANGGGPCYILSIGNYAAAMAAQDFIDAINSLESVDEPTLLVFPDATLLADDNAYSDVVDAALSHCAKMQDRFTICDVRNAVVGQVDTNAEVTTALRNTIASDLSLVKYGAAYFPYLLTSLPLVTSEATITVNSLTVDGTAVAAITDTPINNDLIKVSRTGVYDAVRQFVARATATVPPSGAIAGVYARVDNDRGVWKAPANVSLLNVIEPVIPITNDLNDGLNVDATSGKSVNAIRSFTGKGVMVWGARTLAGNDNENRYVPVRRFLIFAEESIKKATAYFVFEPNDKNTWVKVRSMIESFLVRQWRDGALAGAKPEDAFYVKVGLNETMSAQDILDGYLIVEIGLAIVRPAEFIVLRFSQMMQRS